MTATFDWAKAFSLEGKRALVTGGAAGIGQAIAVALAASAPTSPSPPIRAPAMKPPPRLPPMAARRRTCMPISARSTPPAPKR